MTSRKNTEVLEISTEILWDQYGEKRTSRRMYPTARPLETFYVLKRLSRASARGFG